jgi:hypothetical protein
MAASHLSYMEQTPFEVVLAKLQGNVLFKMSTL